jgi:hypothetical protein
LLPRRSEHLGLSDGAPLADLEVLDEAGKIDVSIPHAVEEALGELNKQKEAIEKMSAQLVFNRIQRKWSAPQFTLPSQSSSKH